MLPSILLSLREGIEAALIIGIILSVLDRLNSRHLKILVWWGVATAIAASILAGVGLNILGLEFEGKMEEIFEGLATLFAAGVLTWMIFWMQRQGRDIKNNIESKTSLAINTGKNALFSLAFITVFREGLELAVFLLASSFVSSGKLTLIGASIGLGAALILGWAIYTYSSRLAIQGFFKVTNILLIFFAAGLVAYGVHELNEAGWIPSIIENVWDINHILNEKSQLGLILKALFGFNGNPSLSELISYVLYLISMFIIFFRYRQSELVN